MAGHLEGVVIIGGTVKALGNGKVGGQLIRYGAENDRDRVGDFFHEATDYGPHKTSPVYYMHGLDKTLKGRILAREATLEKNDIGIWIEAQLKLRDAYERYIMKQVEAGRMGWSSGTPIPFGVKMGEGYRIDTWHLGIDASILPTPAEPRNTVVSVKSLTKCPGIATFVDATETATQHNYNQLRARALLALD